MSIWFIVVMACPTASPFGTQVDREQGLTDNGDSLLKKGYNWVLLCQPPFPLRNNRLNDH
jgi:hypothetical protein